MKKQNQQNDRACRIKITRFFLKLKNGGFKMTEKKPDTTWIGSFKVIWCLAFLGAITHAETAIAFVLIVIAIVWFIFYEDAHAAKIAKK